MPSELSFFTGLIPSAGIPHQLNFFVGRLRLTLASVMLQGPLDVMLLCCIIVKTAWRDMYTLPSPFTFGGGVLFLKGSLVASFKTQGDLNVISMILYKTMENVLCSFS